MILLVIDKTQDKGMEVIQLRLLPILICNEFQRICLPSRKLTTLLKFISLVVWNAHDL